MRRSAGGRVGEERSIIWIGQSFVFGVTDNNLICLWFVAVLAVGSEELQVMEGLKERILVVM